MDISTSNYMKKRHTKPKALLLEYIISVELCANNDPTNIVFKFIQYPPYSAKHELHKKTAPPNNR